MKNPYAKSHKNLIAYGLVGGLAFAGGCVYRNSTAPHKLSEYWSPIERAVSSDPRGYERVIDMLADFSHDMKAKANPGRAKEGCAEYKDLRLVLVDDGGLVTFLANTATGETLPVLDIEGTTAAGTYNQRLASIKSESVDKTKEMYGSAIDKAKGLLEKLFDYGNKIKPKWMKEKVDQPMIDGFGE